MEPVPAAGSDPRFDAQPRRFQKDACDADRSAQDALRARLTVTGRVKRCHATNADPETGTRTTDLPRLLHSRFGHMDFGVYARVMNGGDISLDDKVMA